jgi:hypothetical protein
MIRGLFGVLVNWQEDGREEAARKDTTESIDLAATWLTSRTTSLRFDLNHARNDSNIDVYSYRRTAYSVKARYEFF